MTPYDVSDDLTGVADDVIVMSSRSQKRHQTDSKRHHSDTSTTHRDINQKEQVMSTPTSTGIAYGVTAEQIRIATAWEDQTPSARAPRSSRRIAMHPRREQDRRQSGW